MVDGGGASQGSGVRSLLQVAHHGRVQVDHVIVQVLDQLLALLVGKLSVTVRVVLRKEHLDFHIGKVAPKKDKTIE